MKERKIVSSHGYHSGKGSVDWSVFRTPDWEYPLHKEAESRKVLAGFRHGQA